MILENLRKVCLEKGITFNKIESECGLSHGSIRKWNEHPPTVTRAKVVCDYLGIKIDDLFKTE